MPCPSALSHALSHTTLSDALSRSWSNSRFLPWSLSRDGHPRYAALLRAPDEQPILVLFLSRHAIERLLRAPARNSHDSAHARIGSAASETRLESPSAPARRRPVRALRARALASGSSKLGAASIQVGDSRLLAQLLLRQLPTHLKLGRELSQDAPLAFLAPQRILVCLAQELLLDEHVDVRGIGAGVFPLVALDRLHVLIAPEDELLLALPLDGFLPEGNGRNQRDREDDEQDGDAEKDVAGVVPRPLASHSSPPRARS